MLELILAKEEGRAVDPAAFDAQAAGSVDEIVAAQVAAGVDIVSDGEMSKPSYTTYVRHRVNGIEPNAAAAEKGRQVMIGRDLLEHPDFAERMVGFKSLPFPGCVGPLSYRDRASLDRDLAHLDAATAALPPDRMRMHVCWGNYEGPHTHDIPLAKIVDICFMARPQALSFEGANPRHEHEWEDLAQIRVPDDKVLIPGVIDSTTNFVEHPRLIAQRICRYAEIVGRERVLAGADCGFATVGTGAPIVVPSIVWAKFKALAEGARIATDRLRRGESGRPRTRVRFIGA